MSQARRLWRRFIWALLLAGGAIQQISVHAQIAALYAPEVVSREVSAFSGDSPTNLSPRPTSREVAVFVGGAPDRPQQQVVSREVSFITATRTPPEAIQGLRVTISPADDRVVLDWSHYNEVAQGDVRRYDIFVGEAAFTNVATLRAFTNTPAGRQTLTLEGLASAKDRFFAVVPVDVLGGRIQTVEYAGGYVLFPELVAREVSVVTDESGRRPYGQVISREVSVVTGTQGNPAPVTNLVVEVSPSGGQIFLDWTSYNETAQGDVARYLVFRSVTPFTNVTSSMQAYTTLPAGSRKTAVEGLASGGDLYLAVVAVDSTGGYESAVRYVGAYPRFPQVLSREYSVHAEAGANQRFHELVSREYAVVMPTAQPPQPVSAFTVVTSGSTPSAIDIDWSAYNEIAQADVREYRIYSEGAHFRDVASLVAKATVPAGTRRFTLGGLLGGETYYVAVVAVDVLNGLNASVEARSAPASYGSLGEVRSLAVNSSTNALRFTWLPPVNSDRNLREFRVYFDNTVQPAVLPPASLSYERTGLSTARGYPVRISTVDLLGTESSGLRFTAATWLTNPVPRSAEGLDGRVRLRWAHSEPSVLLKHYEVFAARTNFSSVEGKTPVLVTRQDHADVTGLLNGISQFYAIRAVNISDGASPQVRTIQGTPEAAAGSFADLWNASVTSEATVYTGQPASFSWSVTNVGAVVTSSRTGTPVAAWVDRVVLSPDDILGDATDRVIAEVPRAGSLAPGQGYAGSVTVPVPSDLSGSYYVFVSVDALDTVYEQLDLADNVVQAPSRLQIQANVIPWITRQPVPREVEQGDMLAFSVTAIGSMPLTYEWRRDGSPVNGGTNATLVLTNVQPAQGGQYSVLVSNSHGSATSSNALLTVVIPDTQGPSLVDATYGGVPLTNGLVVSKSGEFRVRAVDPSGVSRVEFYIGEQMMGIDNTGADDFTAYWNLESYAVGAHPVVIKAADTRNNLTALTNQVTLVVLPAPAPLVLSPANGAVVADLVLPVRGKGSQNTHVVTYRNGSPAGAATPVSLAGEWSTTLALLEGTNRFEFASRNRAGEGPRSQELVLIRDTSLPQPPSGVDALAREGGQIQVRWAVGADRVRGYHVYRAPAAFTDLAQAVRLTTAPVTETSWLDRPDADGRYYYRITTVSVAGAESSPSFQADAVSDRVVPFAESILYIPGEHFDPVTRRYGRGIVDVQVVMSESLPTPPFLSLNPAGGAPILVDLRPDGDARFRGTFALNENTPSGTAQAALSARDGAGNRGSEIRSGDSLLVDTEGPAVAQLWLQPEAPIRNAQSAPVLVQFTAEFTEPVPTNRPPRFTYRLSGSAPGGQTVSQVLPGADATTWEASFRLPPGAGITPERLEIAFEAEDDLDNPGSIIQAPHEFEVYQGSLPALEAPLGLIASGRPAGAVELGWRAVPGAAGYRVYRKTASQTAWETAVASTESAAWRDVPPTDGIWQYAVSSIRRAQGAEALSTLSAPATARSDRVAPPSPLNLQVELAGNGAFLRWSEPSGLAEQVTYQLYRTNRGPVVSVSGAAPLLTRIPGLQVVDPSPTPFAPYYVVVAVDAVGNLSPVSSTAYLNAELLPASGFSVVVDDRQRPVLAWEQLGVSLAGHKLFLGEDGAWTQLNGLIPIGVTRYSDEGYTGGERRYTLVTVDQNQQESIGRSLRLPSVSFGLSPGSLVKRGLLNRVVCQVTNTSAFPIENALLVVSLAGREHDSPGFRVEPGQAVDVPVIVGGYPELSGSGAPVTTRLEIRPNEAELVSISRTGRVAIGDGQLIVTVMASDVTRGGMARVQFGIHNPSPAEVEVLTATGGGSGTSPEVRFTLLNAEGQVLSTIPMHGSVGAGVVNLPDGRAVLRVGPGRDGLSPQADLPVPETAPDRVYVRVEIDQVHHHLGGEDAVVMPGVRSSQEFMVVETSYTGRVTAVQPVVSQGLTPIVIQGTARFRQADQPAPYAVLRLKVANGGFERTEDVVTDAQGNFRTEFKPLPTEPGGVYRVWAVHPDLVDRSVQASFTIQRVLVEPGELTIRSPNQYQQPIRLTASAGPGTVATNLHLEYREEDQPTGKPSGIAVGFGPAVPYLAEGASAPLEFSLLRTNTGSAAGQLYLRLASEGPGAAGWQKVLVHYEFSEATPRLRWTPEFVDTGVAPGSNVTETVVLENVGVVAAQGVSLSLLNLDRSPAPPWASLSSVTNLSTLPVGGTFPVGLVFQPPAAMREGDYEFVLAIDPENGTSAEVGIHVAVAGTGRGDAQFKVIDMYTQRVGATFVDGVTNALIQLEHQSLLQLKTNVWTDVVGEARLEDLAAGEWKYRVSADKHHSQTGRFWVRPGATVNQHVALTYNLVSVEWEVVPITIQDRYELVLKATFETDVPAPVVTIEPAVVNLPHLSEGDVYYGEFAIRNQGLIRADHLAFTMPAADENLRYELMGAVPTRLEARETIRVPFRVICHRTLPSAETPETEVRTSPIMLASTRAAPASRCSWIYAGVNLTFDYECVNGQYFLGGAASTFFYGLAGVGCPGGPGGGGGGPGFTLGGPPTGSGSPGFVSIKGPGLPECCPPTECEPESECDTQCCEAANATCSRNRTPPPTPSAPPVPGRADEEEGGSPALAGLRQSAGPVGRKWAAFEFTNQLECEPDGTTHLESDRRRLKFERDAEGLNVIRLGEVPYSYLDAARSTFAYRANRIRVTASGYRWENLDGRWEEYDSAGRLVKAGRRNLLHVSYLYDSAGRLKEVQDAAADPLASYTYTPEGQVKEIRDRFGRTLVFTYEAGVLRSARNVHGRETKYEYTADPSCPRRLFVRRVTLPNGAVQVFDYRGLGCESAVFLTGLYDGAGNGRTYEQRYELNTRSYHLKETTTGGLVREKAFDRQGQLAEERVNGTSRRRIVRSGRTEVTTDALGNSTRRDLNERGQVLREQAADGGITTWEYHPRHHQPVRKVDPRGAVTVMRYDDNGNLISRAEAVGTPIARTNSWVYNGLNQLIRQVDARGNAMEYDYDAQGHRVREFDPANPAYQTLYGYGARGQRTSVTNALGHVTRYGYDDSARVIAETNALGHVSLYTYQDDQLMEVETGRDGVQRGRIVRYRYDDHGRRTQTIRVDGEGREHVWETKTYNNDGQVATVANALEQATRHEYDSEGRRNKVIRPYSATETSDIGYDHDLAGHMTVETDPLGVITRHDHDAMGRSFRVTEAVGTDVQRSRTHDFDRSGNLISIAYSDGTNTLTTYYDYDLLSRRIAIRGAREYPKQFEYDANDNLVAEINGRGYRTEHRYDAYNRRTNTVEGIGHGEPGEHAGSWVYDPVGNIVTVYDGNRNHRHYHHDALGRRTEESIPLAPTNSLPTSVWWSDDAVVLARTWFNAWGQPVATSNIVGGVTATVYDALGRQFTHTDAAGLTLTNLYNANDQLVEVWYPVVSTAPEGSPPTAIRYSYDEQNAQMLVSTTDRANLTTTYGYDRGFRRTSDLSSWGARTTYRVDVLGRQIAVTNALDEVTGSVFDQFDQLVATVHADHIPVTQERVEYRAYDAFGRITKHWGAATYDVRYDYDPAGNQISLTDGNGNTTRWEYDGRNRKVRKVYADESDYEYGYDANGNLTRKRDAMQRTTSYTFSAYNLLVTTDYPSDPDVTFGYDQVGRRVLMLDGTGTNTWSYDAAGRVLTNAQLNVLHSVSYSHDTEGNRLSMRVTALSSGDSWHTEYTYDEASRLERLTDHSVSEHPFLYTWAQSALRLHRLRGPSLMETIYGYDQLARRNLLYTRDASGAEVLRFRYEYDAAGQQISEEALTHTDYFGYDARRQCVSAERYDQNGNPDKEWSRRYAYDAIGNRREIEGPGKAWLYTVNSLNQYTAVSGSLVQRISYDSNGNLLSDGATLFSFDDNDRLLSASNIAECVTFKHDGIHRQVQRNLKSAMDLQRCVYDGSLMIAGFSAGLSNSFRISRGLDLGLSHDSVGGIGGLLAISKGAMGIMCFGDVRGNIRLKTVAGQMHYLDYSPFGDPIPEGALLPSLGFSSKEHYERHNLVNFGRRYYHTSLARWLTRDPTEESGGVNLYAFVENHPANAVDPWGLRGTITECYDEFYRCIVDAAGVYVKCQNRCEKCNEQCEPAGCIRVPPSNFDWPPPSLKDPPNSICARHTCKQDPGCVVRRGLCMGHCDAILSLLTARCYLNWTGCVFIP